MNRSSLDPERAPRRHKRPGASTLVRSAAAGCFILLGACYRYTPTNDAPGAGSDIRIRLTEAGAASLAPVLGAGTTSVTGRVVSSTDSDVILIVSETGRGESRVSWGGERVTLPRSALAGAEQRSLDRGRTIGVAAIGVGAAGVIALVVNAIASRSGGDGDGTVVIPPAS